MIEQDRLAAAVIVDAYLKRIIEAAGDSSRRPRMEIARREIRRTARKAHGLQGSDPFPQTVSELTSGWDTGMVVNTAVELAVSRAFAPFDITVEGKWLRIALSQVLADMGGLKRWSHRIFDVQKQARSVHKDVPWFKFGAAVAVLGLAAPAAVFGIGAAAGLSGAAAMAHGLGVLGLGAAGPGMAGGVWLLTIAGGGGVAGASALRTAVQEMTSPVLELEVVKIQIRAALDEELQVSASEDRASALETLEALESEAKELYALHKQVNDSRSPATKEAKDKLDAVREGARWVRKKKWQED